jgi:hypothetical protein
MGHRIRVAEVVEGDDLDVGAELLLRPEEVAADPAEAVDADPDCNAVLASVVLGIGFASSLVRPGRPSAAPRRSVARSAPW